MKLFYLVCTVLIGILILIISVAQFGASCSWFLLASTTRPVFVLLLMSILGAFMGSLFMLFILAPKSGDQGLNDADGE